MFGYVTPLEPELRVKEQRLYKAVYCGLCRTMGKRVCSESRLTLSYDMVFLALVRFLLSEERLELEDVRCGTSLHKKKTVIKRKVCKAGCIGCKKCAKAFPDLFNATGGLVRAVEPEKLTAEDLEKISCPVHVLHLVEDDFPAWQKKGKLQKPEAEKEADL